MTVQYLSFRGSSLLCSESTTHQYYLNMEYFDEMCSEIGAEYIIYLCLTFGGGQLKCSHSCINQ